MRTLVTVLVCLLAGGSALAAPPDSAATETEEQLRERMAQELVIPVDLESIKEELSLEMATFEDKGVVSVEGGAACLDTQGDGAQQAQMDNTTPQIDPTRAILRVRIVIPEH